MVTTGHLVEKLKDNRERRIVGGVRDGSPEHIEKKKKKQQREENGEGSHSLTADLRVVGWVGSPMWGSHSQTLSHSGPSPVICGVFLQKTTESRMR